MMEFVSWDDDFPHTHTYIYIYIYIMQKSNMYKNVPNHQPNEFSVFSRLEKGEQCFFVV